jgi:hypothetical protein
MNSSYCFAFRLTSIAYRITFSARIITTGGKPRVKGLRMTVA